MTLQKKLQRAVFAGAISLSGQVNAELEILVDKKLEQRQEQEKLQNLKLLKSLNQFKHDYKNNKHEIYEMQGGGWSKFNQDWMHTYMISSIDADGSNVIYQKLNWDDDDNYGYLKINYVHSLRRYSPDERRKLGLGGSRPSPNETCMAYTEAFDNDSIFGVTKVIAPNLEIDLSKDNASIELLKIDEKTAELQLYGTPHIKYYWDKNNFGEYKLTGNETLNVYRTRFEGRPNSLKKMYNATKDLIDLCQTNKDLVLKLREDEEFGRYESKRQ